MAVAGLIRAAELFRLSSRPRISGDWRRFGYGSRRVPHQGRTRGPRHERVGFACELLPNGQPHWRRESEELACPWNGQWNGQWDGQWDGESGANRPDQPGRATGACPQPQACHRRATIGRDRFISVTSKRFPAGLSRRSRPHPVTIEPAPRSRRLPFRRRSAVAAPP